VDRSLPAELQGGLTGQGVGPLGVPLLELERGERQPALGRAPLLAQPAAGFQGVPVVLGRLVELALPGQYLGQAEEGVRGGALVADLPRQAERVLELPPGSEEIAALQEGAPQVGE